MDSSRQSGVYTTRQGRQVAWRVRSSPRAKHVRIVLSDRGDISVVVPQGHRGTPETLLADHDAWIDRALARLECQVPESDFHSANVERRLPVDIVLPTADEAWQVVYTATSGSRVTTRADTATCVVGISGAVHEEESTVRALRRFITRRAEAVLPLRLQDIAKDRGLLVRSVRVYPARSRWGSCSGRGDIMLSARLLFLPSGLSEHVMLHELAHLSSMSHGSRFHERLDLLDPSAREHANGLRHAGLLVPWWMDAQ